MANWLFKTEPSEFSYQDLLAAGETLWDGVANALALKHLRAVQPQDRVLIYHTGCVKAIIGGATVTRVTAEPLEVFLRATQFLPNPVTLSQIKATPELAGCELVRLPRLSVMPISEPLWLRFHSLSDAAGESSPPTIAGG